MENLGKEFSFHRRAELPLSVIFFDLDDFKHVNDTYGHLCGDLMLRSVTEAIKAQIREEDCFARYGGEEFVIFLKNTTMDAARLIAEKFRQVLEKTRVFCEDTEVGVTGSFGVVTYFADNFQSADQMLIIADTLMYQAKQAGKNRVLVSDK
jgi:diguanylate cyclase (GGDEF)-like protein